MHLKPLPFVDLGLVPSLIGSRWEITFLEHARFKSLVRVRARARARARARVRVRIGLADCCCVRVMVWARALPCLIELVEHPSPLTDVLRVRVRVRVMDIFASLHLGVS